MNGVEAIEEMVKIQTSNGNWNCDPYSLGYANGLILALATMKNEEPVFLNKPDAWLSDVPTNAQPVRDFTMTESKGP